MIWVLVALAADPDPAVAREERVVAEAAAAVAQARHDGLRPAKIAELMAIYRQEAERLDGMRPPAEPSPGEEGARAAALRALSEATALGVEASAARAQVEAWLGPLGARVAVLGDALAAARLSPEALARSIAADVLSQATAVKIAAIYDASREDAALRSATTRAAALRAAQSPLERTGLAEEAELAALARSAAAASSQGAAARELARSAAGLGEEASLILGEE